MEDERTLAEQIIAGDADLGDFDVNNDFDDDETQALLEAGLVHHYDFNESRATELIIDGVLDYTQRPFEDFSPYEQLRQLAGGAISPAEFKKRVKLEDYDADDRLELVALAPEFSAQAEWEKLRRESSPQKWFELLERRPEFADKADWERLCREGSARDAFAMLEKQPALYDRMSCKDELLEADSRYWVDLIIRQPRFADVYPVETLDEVDEVEELLLYRPELARRIPWDEDDQPVKVFIRNSNVPLYGHYDEIREILQASFFYRPYVAGGRTDLVTENAETFAGIFSTRTAHRMASEFRRAVREAKLPLAIRMEKLGDGD